MLGRYQIKITRFIAAKNKSAFVKEIPALINKIPDKTVVNCHLVSFSGSKYFNDQLLSIFSFYYNVGKPLKWKIFNDGTYSKSEKDVLLSIPNVEICEVDLNGVDEDWLIACNKFPTLKKMFIFSRLNIESTSILIDSDILFYPSFIDCFSRLSQKNWYIQDESNNYLDKDYIEQNPHIQHPLNLGFIVLNKKPNWQIVLDYIHSKIQNNTLHYWTDQTAMHILVSQQNSDFSPLAKNIFVVNGSDGFKIKHDFDYDKIAVRHFVGPIRHKMWQYSCEKLLGL